MTAVEPPAFGGADPAQLRIEHEVAVDPRNGRVPVRVPLDVATGRSGFGPRLALRYDSSGANDVWGTGWSLDGLLAISVSTRLRDPSYDARDTYASSVAGELVPMLVRQNGQWVPKVATPAGFTVRYWRARRESARLRVEQ
jgi:virulence plasmid B protein